MMRIARFDLLDSTNDKARDAEFQHGDIVVAEGQSAGRGQRGNKWDSRQGENLTFSLILEPDFLPAEEQFLLLQVVALGISDMLASRGIAPRIKWTNDIYVGDRKIAGVLIENDICGSNLARSIVGVGLNVNQTQFAEWLPNPTSMAIECGAVDGKGRSKFKGNNEGESAVAVFDRDEVLTDTRDAILKRFCALRSGDIEALQHDYHALIYRLDARRTYALPSGERFEGVIRGVDPGGELQVEHPDGVVRGYLFKEIEFVL